MPSPTWRSVEVPTATVLSAEVADDTEVQDILRLIQSLVLHIVSIRRTRRSAETSRRCEMSVRRARARATSRSPVNDL
jgi:hypothetical protein